MVLLQGRREKAKLKDTVNESNLKVELIPLGTSLTNSGRKSYVGE